MLVGMFVGTSSNHLALSTNNQNEHPLIEPTFDIKYTKNVYTYLVLNKIKQNRPG